MKPHAEEIKYGEDNPIEAAPQVTEEDKFAIQQKMEALDKLLASQEKAKYKIEVFFGSARSMTHPTAGAMSFWENGTMLHGGGDAKIYFCPGKDLGKNACDKPIPFALNAYGFLVCPHCQQTWKGEQVIGEILAKLSMRGWSELIYKYFRRLEGNCDIYVKHAKDDIRTAAHSEQNKQQHGEVLHKSRQKRALYIYPLRNLLKDTAHGADVLTRFYALLTA